MINEEKVILMTKLSTYEESTGKEDLNKARFFQSDYVRLNCLKTLVSTTILFWGVAAMYVYYNLAKVIENLTTYDYGKLARNVLLAYVAVCVVYFIIAWLVYTYRYSKAKPGLIRYNQNLKALIDFYDEDGNTIKNSGRKR